VAVQDKVTAAPEATVPGVAEKAWMTGSGPVGGVVYTVPICTTSRSAPVMFPKACRSSSSQPGSGQPVRYQAEPLSARIIPYFLRPRRMTWAWGPKPEMSLEAFRRTRMPMGGALGSLDRPAIWVAGSTKDLAAAGTVNRRACLTSPAATSSYTASPGNTGRPPASLLVQPQGRWSLIVRSQMAPLSAFQEPSGWRWEA